MGRSILGLTIEDNNIKALLLQAKFKSLEVMECFQVLKDDKGIGAAVKELKDKITIKPDSVYLTFNISGISFRVIKLPFKDTKGISKALPFELEATLPFSLDEKVIDFCHYWNETSSHVVVCLLPREIIATWLEELRKVNLEPEVVDVSVGPISNYLIKQNEHNNFFMLHIAESTATISIVEANKVAFIRQIKGLGSSDGSKYDGELLRLANEVKITLTSYKASFSPSYVPAVGYIFGKDSSNFTILGFFEENLGVPITSRNILSSYLSDLTKPIGADLDISLVTSTALLGVELKPTFDLRKEAFPKETKLPIVLRYTKFTSILFLIVLILLGLKEFVTLSIMETRLSQLNTQLNTIYLSTFKETKPGADPLVSAKTQLKEFKKRFKDVDLKVSSIKTIDILNDVFQNIPDNVKVEFDRLVVDNEAIQIVGQAESYNSIDILKNQLQSIPYVSESNIQSAKADKSGKNINFEIRLKRKG